MTMTKVGVAGSFLALTMGIVTSAFPQSTETKSMNEALTFNADGSQRYSDIHWPEGFHPEQADLFAHNEIRVHASCDTVFANIANAEEWPSWYPNSHNVKLLDSADHKLHKGTHFSWETFGLNIESRVHEFLPNSRIGWFGDGTGMNAYHTFLLLKTVEGCHVITEEVVKGPGAIEFRKNQPNAMHEGHDLWLNTLKQLSEK